MPFACGAGTAEKGHIYAHIELAKHYEHKERDAKTSLKWARSGRREVSEPTCSPTSASTGWQR